jgi:aldose 1-epimerase
VPNGYELKTTLPPQPNGFPGFLAVTVTYLLEDNKIKIIYAGTSDHVKTIFNPTQHAYFNLSGNAQETITDHILQIDANRFAEINANSSFTKTLIPVVETRFNFLQPTKIDATAKPAHEQYDLAGGYDHLFILNQNYDRRPAAIFTHPASKRQLSIYTTEPTLQFYAGNFLEGITFEGNIPGRNHLGACFETHKNPFDFESQIINPGVATKVQETVWEFTKGTDKVIILSTKKEATS